MEDHNNYVSSFVDFLQLCIAQPRHSNSNEAFTIGPIVLGVIEGSCRLQRNSELAFLPLWQIGFSG